VRWLGGGSGAGKTALARLLAERFGLRVYHSDGTIREHGTLLDRASAPLLDRFRRMSMDERWVQRDPMTMYRTFPWFHGEGFELLTEDVGALSDDGIVLAEGFRLLPALVWPHLAQPAHALWLIPTPTFREAAFSARGAGDAFWLRTTDPQQALANLLERDRIFTNVLAAEAGRLGLSTRVVDGARSLEDTADAVAEQFGLVR
jgi:hypothetical protein